MKMSFSNEEVEAAFDGFSKAERAGLMQLRALIFSLAEKTEGVGKITECLKWGQPSYLTSKPKSGTTIRLGVTKSGEIGVFVHCQTTIIEEMREMFGDEFRYDGNRAIVFKNANELTTDVLQKLEFFIHRALTYHL